MQEQALPLLTKLVPDAERRDGLRSANGDEPATAFRGATAPAPTFGTGSAPPPPPASPPLERVGDVDELADLFVHLVEEADDPAEVERLLEGVCRLPSSGPAGAPAPCDGDCTTSPRRTTRAPGRARTCAPTSWRLDGYGWGGPPPPLMLPHNPDLVAAHAHARLNRGLQKNRAATEPLVDAIGRASIPLGPPAASALVLALAAKNGVERTRAVDAIVDSSERFTLSGGLLGTQLAALLQADWWWAPGSCRAWPRRQRWDPQRRPWWPTAWSKRWPPFRAGGTRITSSTCWPA